MTPEEIIDLALGILPDRDLHEFGLWCAEQVKHLMSDERSRRALDVKRRWLDGQATDEELEKAEDAAKDAAWAAARDAAWVAAWAVARGAAWAAEAAKDAARAAAWNAAKDAARGAARTAARTAAGEVARKSQADWLLKNYGSQILHHRMKE